MNKSWFYLGAIGSLAIVMTSCGDSNKPATPAASPIAAASPAVIPSPVAAVPATPAATPAIPTTTTPAATGTPTIAGKKSVSVDVAAGLIAPTNGDNWAKTVSKGRSDPFAVLALQPIEVTEKNPLDPNGKSAKAESTASKSSGANGKTSNQTQTISSNSSASKSGINKPLPTIKISSSNTPNITVGAKYSQPTIKIAARSIRASTGSTRGKIDSNGRGFTPVGIPQQGYTPPGTGYLSDHTLSISAIPRSGINKALPKILNELPAAKPEQAVTLEISGVIEVEGKTQVIVKLPSESFSRYVEVGERIANGKVLVKRVEGQESLSPTIILEEVGIEVSRKIGTK